MPIWVSGRIRQTCLLLLLLLLLLFHLMGPISLQSLSEVQPIMCVFCGVYWNIVEAIFQIGLWPVQAYGFTMLFVCQENQSCRIKGRGSGLLHQNFSRFLASNFLPLLLYRISLVGLRYSILSRRKLICYHCFPNFCIP